MPRDVAQATTRHGHTEDWWKAALKNGLATPGNFIFNDEGPKIQKSFSFKFPKENSGEMLWLEIPAKKNTLGQGFYIFLPGMFIPPVFDSKNPPRLAVAWKASRPPTTLPTDTLLQATFQVGTIVSAIQEKPFTKRGFQLRGIPFLEGKNEKMRKWLRIHEVSFPTFITTPTTR